MLNTLEEIKERASIINDNLQVVLNKNDYNWLLTVIVRQRTEIQTLKQVNSDLNKILADHNQY